MSSFYVGFSAKGFLKILSQDNVNWGVHVQNLSAQKLQRLYVLSSLILVTAAFLEVKYANTLSGCLVMYKMHFNVE